MTKTPRTDAATLTNIFEVSAQLETELDTAKTEYVRDVLALNKELEAAKAKSDRFLNGLGEWATMANKAEAENNAMRDAATDVIYEATNFLAPGLHDRDQYAAFRIALQKLTDLLAK